MRTIRFTLSRALCGIILLLSVLTVVATNYQHRRQVRQLQAFIDQTHEQITIAQYGEACLQIVSLHPKTVDNLDCRRLLEHELAKAVIQHWEQEAQIDHAMQSSGYSKRFAGSALTLLEVANAADFFKAARSSLWIYPDDDLYHLSFEIEDHNLVAFERFIQESLETVK